MKKAYLLLLLLGLISVSSSLFAQNLGQIAGKVQDKNSQELLIGATVILEGTSLGAQTDAEGKFQIKSIPPKSYNLKIQYIGYESKTIYNIVVTTGNILTFTVELEPQTKGLNEVLVQTRTFGKKTETPLSIQSLTAEEIRSNPGGNFDISRVIQALPGVGGNTGGASFRNDIIIRGGGPNENVFYIDGIEIPVINHFSTQGSSGGPQGILNVSFIQDVTLASSSFGARVDNTLSSVFTFKQKEGNSQRLQGNVRLSASEFALTLDGPLTKNTTFLASARRSYLQFLFMALDIPIRPNYWDFQYKTSTKINDKLTLTTLGVGAIDQFSFSVPKESSPEKEYAIRSSPNVNQWNYTLGTVLKQKVNRGFVNYSASRNMFNNRLDRYEDGKEKDENFRTLKIESQEIENKFRVDVNKYLGKWKYSYGAMMQYVKYNNQTYNKVSNGIYDTLGNLLSPPLTIQFASAIEYFKGGVFGELSRRMLNDRLNLNFGLRTDVNSFTKTGRNPLKTLSPRISGSYALTEKWSVNATVGRYFKIPIYTVLGFRDAQGEFVNKDNEYIACNHFVTGFEYLPTSSSRITLEGFYKQYSNYPVSSYSGISLANQGADFNILGNEKTNSTGKGRAYGFEFFFQQKLSKNIFATLSYTWFVSEFSGVDGVLKPSAWDNRNLISAILGYKFKKGWELGMKYRYAGGAPYTPFDMDASRSNYLTTGNGVYNYTQLNTLRVGSFNQFDIRVDKKMNFSKVTLDIFVDIQNALLISSESFPSYTFERKADNSDWQSTDGKPVQTNGSNATPVILENVSNTVIPTFGFILEF
ncbi:MAG: TonB-dependent receptor [Bacteroidia bacterium]|nr:TonB-dependent receptor [Bacteroidia bacterium]MCF8426589.1 TonB-dependent receptor [Bacteroidia bacterium]MCF8446753.1 TonB-dependent receptor [Bacteroidia bacterium]